MAAEKDNDTRTNAQSSGLESRTKYLHTPGPWKAEGDLDGVREDYREDRCIVTADFDYDERTGSIIGVLRGHGPELRANARLIAAAPELLRQLKALCVQLEAAGMIVPPGVSKSIAAAEVQS